MAEVNSDTAPQTNGRSSASPRFQPTATAGRSQSTPSSKPVADPSVPLTSLQDTGLSKRPRDARLIHMLLSSLGVTAYQERVPLQLLDFAYRHSSAILSDALHVSDAYMQQSNARNAPQGGNYRDADGQVSSNAVEMAIASRMQYQFERASGGSTSKEYLVEVAQTRNKVALPRVLQNEWGVRLPSERYVFTGVPWGSKDEWEEEPEEEEGDDAMEGIMGMDEETGGEPAERGEMADIFGEDPDDEMKEE